MSVAFHAQEKCDESAALNELQVMEFHQQISPHYSRFKTSAHAPFLTVMYRGTMSKEPW